ncbi:MAG: hypothetical protein H7839_18145, partial [Magnetococcus sp. YQC-5]
MPDECEIEVLASLLLENVATRNKQAVENRKAGLPMIGLFWFDEGRILFPVSEPIKEVPTRGGFKDIDQTHERVWRQLRVHVPKYKLLEYEEVPRGRVVYQEADKLFMVYSSRKLGTFSIFSAWQKKPIFLTSPILIHARGCKIETNLVKESQRE